MVLFPLSWLFASTFLASFAPHPLRYINAHMMPLTPDGVSSPPGLPDSHSEPSNHSVLNHTTCLRHRFNTLPLTVADVSTLLFFFGRTQTSPLGCRLVSMSRRIRFVILRTGYSPPVASHPTSRQRSYFQLRGRRAYAPERTFTSLIPCAFRRTPLPACPAGESVHQLTHPYQNQRPLPRLIQSGQVNQFTS